MADQEAARVGNTQAQAYHSGTAGTAEMIRGVGNSDGAALTAGNWTAYTGSVVIPASGTIIKGTATVTISGRTHGVTLQTIAMDGSDSTLLELVDSLGGTVLSLGTQAESVSVFYGTVQPVNTTMSWIMTAEGTQPAAATVPFVVHYEK